MMNGSRASEIPSRVRRSTISPWRIVGSRYSPIAVSVALPPEGVTTLKLSPTPMWWAFANCSSITALSPCSRDSVASEP